MCITAIGNLQQAAHKDGEIKLSFSKDKEIIPFIEQYWESMTTLPRRITQSWYATVQRTLVKDIHTLFTYEESVEHGQMYGLINVDLTQIKPNYDAMIKSGTLKITDDGVYNGKYPIN
jgi:Set1/Ash2 histone methyltransferase complex subunit ASH2